MAEGFADWADLTAFACTLPGVEMLPHYGQPSPKVSGRAFLAPGREAGSFVLMLPLDEKAMLMEIAPRTFWETPHYGGWPGVLVRYGAGEREWLETLVKRAWWDRAGKALRAGFGPRP